MKKTSKKGQVKMFESIAVLIIFFFLLSFGFTFYGKMQQISNMKKMRQATEIDTVSLAIKTSNLAELQCSIKNVGEPNCYDWYKIKAFQHMLQDSENNEFLTDHYYQKLGYSRIELNIIYPDHDSILLYNRTRDLAEGGGSIVTLMPISVYNPTDKKHRFAYLNITYYSPE